MSFTVPIAESDVTNLVADLAAKAPLASPTLTSTPSFPTGTTAVTQSAADSSTKLATTAFATTADNLKANLASPTFTGTVTTPNGVGATDLAAFGQIPTVGTTNGLVKLVFRTSDSATKSNATYANDDTLLGSVGANDQWLFQGFLTFTAADNGGSATTADAKINFNVPASGTIAFGAYGSSNNAFSGYGSAATSATPGAPGTNDFTQGGAALSWGVAIAGYYTGGGTSGTVNLKWSQNTTNVSTLLMAKNSLLMLVRLA